MCRAMPPQLPTAGPRLNIGLTYRWPIIAACVPIVAEIDNSPSRSNELTNPHDKPSTLLHASLTVCALYDWRSQHAPAASPTTRRPLPPATLQRGRVAGDRCGLETDSASGGSRRVDHSKQEGQANSRDARHQRVYRHHELDHLPPESGRGRQHGTVLSRRRSLSATVRIDIIRTDDVMTDDAGNDDSSLVVFPFMLDWRSCLAIPCMTRSIEPYVPTENSPRSL